MPERVFIVEAGMYGQRRIIGCYLSLASAMNEQAIETTWIEESDPSPEYSSVRYNDCIDNLHARTIYEIELRS